MHERHSGRPFAAFDIDGTLLRWQLYHALNDALVKRGSIDAAAFQRARDARMNWKRRSGEDAFKEYEKVLVEVFDDALSDLTVEAAEAAVGQVFSEYRDQVYTYTRDLMKELRRKGYVLFAVSGSPLFIVERFAEYYGFDDWVGTKYPTADGRFAGTKELSLGKKHELLQDLIEKHGAIQADSLAIGDTESDIDMLAMAERAIAFNPSKKLFQHAEKQGWEIVIERKNVVYKLERTDRGTYVLA